MIRKQAQPALVDVEDELPKLCEEVKRMARYAGPR